MDLSIIVCCYLQEGFMGESIASARNQQFNGSFEAIEHHDNCSTKSGTGACNAYNLAISQSTGKRILLVDADDKLPVNYAQALWDEMERYAGSKVFAACPTQFISGPTLARFALDAPGLYSMPSKYGLPLTRSIMFDRSAWEEVGKLNPEFLTLEDIDFLYRLMSAGYKCAYTEKTCLLKGNVNTSKTYVFARSSSRREEEAARLTEKYGLTFMIDVI